MKNNSDIPLKCWNLTYDQTIKHLTALNTQLTAFTIALGTVSKAEKKNHQNKSEVSPSLKCLKLNSVNKIFNN